MDKQLPFGPVMVDLDGLELAGHERDRLRHPNTGAVILFARNYDGPAQLRALVAQVRAARPGPLLIAVDQEGGRVQRFRDGFTPLPPAAAYAREPALAEPAGWLMAAELLAAGVDFSFAPVLDVDCGVSQIIGDRAFADDPAQVAELASRFRAGMRAAGMAATGKHYPGHGGVAADSHLTLPVDGRGLSALAVRDLVPFRRLIGEGLEAVMPAHVLYPQLDARPAGFSPFWLQQVLRGELGFDGAVFSDDLSMAGAAGGGGFAERARQALAAGCDMVLVLNDPAAAEQVLDALPVSAPPCRQRRLAAMQGRPALDWQALGHSRQWRRYSPLISQLAQTYAR